MTAEQFTYWLNGFIELNDGQLPTAKQWQVICDHLTLVFTKVTPNYGNYGISISERFAPKVTDLVATC